MARVARTAFLGTNEIVRNGSNTYNARSQNGANGWRAKAGVHLALLQLLITEWLAPAYLILIFVFVARFHRVACFA